LSDEIVRGARARATKPIEADELQRAALRVGAPIAKPPVDSAASELLAEMSKGRRPRRALRRLLADAVDSRDSGLSDAARAAQEWIGATAEERGEALRQLLLLGDALPERRRPDHIRFPRFRHP
jgi:hypothetical protein